MFLAGRTGMDVVCNEFERDSMARKMFVQEGVGTMDTMVSHLGVVDFV